MAPKGVRVGVDVAAYRRIKVGRSNELVNPGRELCFQAFRETLDDVYGKEAVTELQFMHEWLSRIRRVPLLSANGWYDPPPEGVAVFSGRDDSSEPFRFPSLRQPDYWPSSDKAIDWRHGILYAYCSPVDVEKGLPADFGISLYFGTDQKIVSFFKAALQVAKEIIDAIEPSMTAGELFIRAAQVMEAAHIHNNVTSVTHDDPNDIGHSFPRLSTGEIVGRHLDAAAISKVRNSRKYVCIDDTWPLSSVAQFTVEPNLVSADDPSLPQISPHYVIAIEDDSVIHTNDCDELFKDFGFM